MTAKNSVYVCKYQHALGRAQKPMAFCSLLSMRKQHGRYQCCSLFVSGGKNLRNTHGFGTPYTIIFDPGAAPATGQGEKKPLKYKRARESCWSKVFSCSSQKISTLQDSKFQQTKLLLLNKFFCVNFPAHDQSQERYVLFGILLQPALQPASITTQVRSDSKSGWKKQLPKCWNLQHFSTYPAFYLHFCERVKPPKNGLPNKRRPTNFWSTPGVLDFNYWYWSIHPVLPLMLFSAK